jgi:hypothetical protein
MAKQMDMRREKKMAHPTEHIAEALETFKERNKVYGDNYLTHGTVMKALFPNGVDLKTEKEYNRFGIVNMMVAKLTRYCQSWPAAHQDSIHDLGVYSFMLESLDDDSV